MRKRTETKRGARTAPHDNSIELLSESLGACRGHIKGRSCVDRQKRALQLLNGAALHHSVQSNTEFFRNKPDDDGKQLDTTG